MLAIPVRSRLQHIGPARNRAQLSSLTKLFGMQVSIEGCSPRKGLLHRDLCTAEVRPCILQKEGSAPPSALSLLHPVFYHAVSRCLIGVP